MFQLEGIYAPIPVPFLDDTGEIDEAALETNMEFWNQSSLSGIVVMGSNGEFVLLDMEEKRKLINLTVKYANNGKHVIAGTGCESTRDTIRMCKVAGEAGCDAALVLSPNYYKKAMQTERVIMNFYEEVADASPIPVIIYNMPGNSGINIPAAVTAKLSAHPNIMGIKDSGGNIVQIMETIKNAADDFSVFAGSASFLYPTIMAGGKGGTLALANIMPEECVKLYHLAKNGETERAAKVQMALLEPNAAVTSKWGIPGLKAAMELIGKIGGRPRHPFLPLGEKETNELKMILAKAKEQCATL